MVEVLCAIVRATGISDSGAAGRASVHPATVSRWKKAYPDFALLLRKAREEFRAGQLELILGTARSDSAGGWRAAAWLLERTFPEDYAPRARERAQFREDFEAAWAAEEEGFVCKAPAAEVTLERAGEAAEVAHGVAALPAEAEGAVPTKALPPRADGAAPSNAIVDAAPARVEALQNLHNSRSGTPARQATAATAERRALQNLHNSGPLPQPALTKCGVSASTGGDDEA